MYISSLSEIDVVQATFFAGPRLRITQKPKIYKPLYFNGAAAPRKPWKVLTMGGGVGIAIFFGKRGYS